MAVYKKKLNGYKVKINDTDHLPPHCHAFIGSKNVIIDLYTLQVRNPPPKHVPPQLNKALKRELTEMLKSWEQVNVIPTEKEPD